MDRENKALHFDFEARRISEAWYQKGVEEEDPVFAFVSFWIVLNQLYNYEIKGYGLDRDHEKIKKYVEKHADIINEHIDFDSKMVRVFLAKPVIRSRESLPFIDWSQDVRFIEREIQKFSIKHSGEITTNQVLYDHLELIDKDKPTEKRLLRLFDYIYAFITWGDADIFMLEDNMSIHEMDIDALPECYDAQVVFDDQITQEDRSFALSYAMWKFDIKPERSHDALNDAINTVEVMKKLDLSEGLDGYEI